MVKEVNKLLAIFFVALLAASPVRAGEFGNVFGNEATQAQSREASAQALLAIENIIRAIRLRETGESQGTEELSVALDNLSEASSKMRELIGQDFPDFELTEDQLGSIAQRMGDGYRKYDGLFVEARTFSSFFRDFAELGDRLAGDVKGWIGTPIEQQILPEFSERLEDYLAAGELVTVLSRSQFQ